jgi:formylglycine-generating enzyme required for sulfatase activity
MNIRLLLVPALLTSIATAASFPRMAPIPAGSFEMGDHVGFVDPKHGGDETPIHAVRLDAFEMGIYDITTAQFCEFLNSAMEQNQIEVRSGGIYLIGGSDLLCETRKMSTYSRIGWDGERFTVLDHKEDHPVVCIRWEGAAVYCNWLSDQKGLPLCYNTATWDCDFNKSGYRLPTEAEWEYAARGGLQNPYCNFPWGDEADASKANWPESKNEFRTGPEPWTTPVGFYKSGVNGYGLYDMAGNVWQFVNDWYQSDYYAYSPTDNPPGPASGKLMPDGKAYRGMRGGNWFNGENGHSRVSNRNPSYWRGPKDPDHPYYHIGFRVVLPVDAESRPVIKPTPVQNTARGDATRPKGGGQPPAGKQPSGKPDKPWLLEHAKELDMDSDGAVAKQELLDEAVKAFGLYDVNHDDTIAAAELKSGMAKTTMGGFIQLHAKELDEDGDGTISKAEMLKVSGALFDKSDKNRDGRLTADEPSGNKGGKRKEEQK